MTVKQISEILSKMHPDAIVCLKHKSYPGDAPDIDEIAGVEYTCTMHYNDTDGLECWGPVVSLTL